MREPNPEKLNELVGKLVGDLGVSLAGASVLLGDRLGLYKAMADGAPVTPSALAKKTKLHERYVREWMCGQAASGSGGAVGSDRARLSRVCFGPSDDRLRLVDDRPVLEHERRNLVAARQLLDRPPSREEPVAPVAPVRLDELRAMANCIERFVRLRARVPLGRPERPVAHVEPHEPSVLPRWANRTWCSRSSSAPARRAR